MHIEVKPSEDESAFFFISGAIDEKAKDSLATLFPHITEKNVFNLRYIDEINSLGILHWVNFIEQIPEDQQIVFQECSSEFVMTMNMIPEMKAHAVIESVIGTYYCTECHHERDFIFESGKNMPVRREAQFFSTDCDNCGRAKMEMFELEEEFFSFNFFEDEESNVG